jgi:flagellar biosynthesis protein FlhA
MPKPAFFSIGILLGFIAFIQIRRTKQEVLKKKLIEENSLREKTEVIDNYDEALRVDAIEIELGYSLINLADSKDYGNLSLRIDLIRKQIISETGFIVPPIRIRDNIQLEDNHYCIKVKGVDVAENEILMDSCLILNPSGEKFEINGVDTIEPVFELPARWIKNSEKDLAEIKGYNVIDPASLLVTHLTEIIKEYAYDLLGLQDVKKLLDKLTEINPVVVNEVMPNLINLSDLTQILKNLLKERIPIKDLSTILETISVKAKITKNIELLTEYVRQGLSRSLTKMFENPPGIISVIVIDPEIEQKIINSIQQTEIGIKCILDPDYVKDLIAKMEEESKRVSLLGYFPILICLAPVRAQLKQLVERVKPKIVVLSYDEIIQDIKIEPIGMIRFREFE